MEQGIIAGICISLKNASPTAQMAHRMLAPPVAGIMEDRCGRCGSAKRSIIPNIGPDPARIGLGLGQHWHRRIVAMQSLGGKDVAYPSSSPASAKVMLRRHPHQQRGPTRL